MRRLFSTPQRRQRSSSGGLAALQALIALKRASDAGEGVSRAQSIARVQEAVRPLDPAAHTARNREIANAGKVGVVGDQDQAKNLDAVAEAAKDQQRTEQTGDRSRANDQ